MRTTIIFKDGSTATFQLAYQLYVDTDSLIINYECYETLGDASPSRNTAYYDISEIAAVVKGECNFMSLEIKEVQHNDTRTSRRAT